MTKNSAIPENRNLRAERISAAKHHENTKRARRRLGWMLTLFGGGAIIFGPLTGSVELYTFGIVMSLSAIAVANLE